MRRRALCWRTRGARAHRRSLQLLAVIQLPGLRKRWDPRFEQGLILQRYNR